MRSGKKVKNKTHELCLMYTCLCLIRHAKDTILNNLYVHYHDKSHCDISVLFVKDLQNFSAMPTSLTDNFVVIADNF